MKDETMVPVWNYDFQWSPEEPRVDMIYEAKPLVRKQVNINQVYEDNFTFPAAEQAERVKYEEPNW